MFDASAQYVAGWVLVVAYFFAVYGCIRILVSLFWSKEKIDCLMHENAALQRTNDRYIKRFMDQSYEMAQLKIRIVNQLKEIDLLHGVAKDIKTALDQSEPEQTQKAPAEMTDKEKKEIYG